MAMFIVPVTHSAGVSVLSLQQAALALQARIQDGVYSAAPGLNIHKAPAAGRTFRYKSRAGITYYNLPMLKPIGSKPGASSGGLGHIMSDIKDEWEKFRKKR